MVHLDWATLALHPECWLQIILFIINLIHYFELNPCIHMLSLFILQTFFSAYPDWISMNTRKRIELIGLDREQFAECESYTYCA